MAERARIDHVDGTQRRTGLRLLVGLGVAALGLWLLSGVAGAAPSDDSRWTASAPEGVIKASVSVGFSHVCGLRGDGTAVCWGNGFGQTSPPAGTYTQVTAGQFHSCGIRSDSTVVCWGSGGFGQTLPQTGTFLQVSAGDSHNCAVRTDGTVPCSVHGTLACSGNSPAPTNAGQTNTAGSKTGQCTGL